MERKIDVVSQDVKSEYLSKKVTSVTTFPDSDKPPSTSSSQDLVPEGSYQPCLTFFARTLSGTTRHLRARAHLPVLVEGSYSPSPLVSHHWRDHPNVIAIAGGVGITALVPDLCSHRGGRTLFWASHSKALIESVQETVGGACWRDMNVRIYHDRRMDIPTLLTEEVQKYQGAPVCVVVSGPARMADEVRHVVSEMVRQNPSLLVSFEEESFSW
jgi:predicted ferric reductase